VGSTTAATAKQKGMCIATRCTSVEQFIEMFHRFVDEDSFFVSTVNTRPPGLETSFSVQLADGTPVLRGLCVVLQAWTSATSPFKTPGVRLGIKRLTANSMPVFERLLVTRSAPPAQGTPVPNPPAASQSTTVLPAPRFGDTGPTTIVQRAEGTGPDAKRPVIEAEHGRARTELTADEKREQEQRTPGSDLVLPANPLMNLTDASLEGYVDCTLYEETATFFAVDDNGTPIEDLVPPPVPPVLAPRPVARLSTPVEIVADEPASIEVASEPDPDRLVAPVRRPQATPPPSPIVPRERAATPSITVPSAPPMFDSSPSITVPAALRDSSPSITVPSGSLDSSPSILVPAAVRESAPAIAVPLAREPLPPARESTPSGEILTAVPPPARPRRMLVIGGASAAVIVALGVWIVTRSGGNDDTAPAPKPARQVAERAADVPPIAEPAPTPAPVPKTDPAPSTPGDDEDTEGVNDPEGTAPTAGEGPCKLAVTSTPAGSIIHLDGKAVAPSPITIATTCERHKVDIKHPRYQLATKFVKLDEGTLGSVDVTLQRPTHQVKITSQPSGATIFIDGRRAGTTPTVVSVMGFSNLKLEFKKTGYAPASHKLYSKVPADNLSVKLTKW
jgi:hypothetical protein